MRRLGGGAVSRGRLRVTGWCGAGGGGAVGVAGGAGLRWALRYWAWLWRRCWDWSWRMAARVGVLGGDGAVGKCADVGWWWGLCEGVLVV